MRDYIKTRRPGFTAEVDFYRCLPSLQAAVDWAGLAKRPDGLRQSHQRRIPELALRQARSELSRTNLKRSNFGEFHKAISDAIRGIPGIGELTVYDTAVRIGAHLRLEPEVVYLHAGTRAGAQALGLPTQQGHLTMQDLPAAFQQLRPGEVEDCLCIYKDVLKT